MDRRSTRESARTAFVVLGPHRSGTSALTGAMNLAGLGAVPVDLVPPHPVDNPTGFWESRSVIELNDAILAEAGGAWDRPPSPIAPSGRDVDRAASLLAHQFPGPASFILKDPRISLLVPLWHEALLRLGVRPSYLIVLRHPAEAAASLCVRDGLDRDDALALWRSYVLAAEAGTRGLERTFVAYDRLLADWQETFREIAAVRGSADPAPDATAAHAIAAFLSPEHWRQRRADLPALRDGGLAERTYHALLAQAAEEAALRAGRGAPVGAPFPPAVEAGVSAAVPRGPAWLLVTGAPRSGTSLLRALLVEHPQVALLQEYGLTELVRRIDAIVDRPPPASADWDSPGDPADARFNAASRFYRDRPGRAAVTRGGGDPRPGHFQAVATGLFAGLFPDKNLTIVGDKMPIGPAWEDPATLFSRLPGLRIIAVIRNPADVVRSSLVRREATRRGRDDWPIRVVREAAAQWIAAWRTLRALKVRYAAAVTVVKYEDLCARPQGVIDDLDAWLGLPSHPVSTPIVALPPDLALHTADEQAELERLLGPVIAAWPHSEAENLMATFAALTPPYLLGEPIHLSREEATSYLISGFSFREDWGRWTDGSRAAVAIPHDVARGLLLVEFRLLQAFAPEGKVCDVVVRSGWGEPKLFQLGPGPARIAFVVQAEEAQVPGLLDIELLVVRPKRPEEPPSDSRALGILIETVTLTLLPGRDPDPIGT